MADILKPDLICIEGRCYRVNDPTTDISTLQEHDLYEDEAICNNEEQDDENDENDDFEVTMLDNSRFSTNIHVPKHYMGYIIGKKAATKMRLERETKTNIKIPKQTESGDIIIVGSNVSNVKAARRRINLIVMASRAKQRPTHFISIPMNTSDIIKNFETFKDQVLKEGSRGIEESIFIRAQKLHLTIGVMCLMDNEERIIASNLLNEAKYKIIMPLLQAHAPLRIHVKGVEYMNDDPKQIDVLYARVYEEGNADVLQTLADQLVDYFCESGYMAKGHNRDHVKLHVTLINSRYRSAQEDETPNQQKRESFDGSEILKKFSDYDFGVVELKEIHLSQRNTIGDDGYYQPTCIISCNTAS